MYVYLDASPPYNTPFRVWGRMISQWLTVHKSEPSPSRWLGPCVSFHGPPIAEDATNPLAIHGIYSATWGENILGTIARVFSQYYQHVAFESMRMIFPNRKPLRLLEGICTGQTSKVYIYTQHLRKYEHTYTSMSKRHTDNRICSIQLHAVGIATWMKGVLHTHKSYGCFQK